MKFLKNLLLSFVFAGVMALGTTSANAACKVQLGDFDWDSANVHTAIASFIIEKGYGSVSYTHLTLPTTPYV